MRDVFMLHLDWPGHLAGEEWKGPYSKLGTANGQVTYWQNLAAKRNWSVTIRLFRLTWDQPRAFSAPRPVLEELQV